MFTFSIRCKEINKKNERIVREYILENSDFKYDDKNYDFLFILGGDGAFLKNVHEYIIKPKKFDVIVITINTGHTGFFMQFENRTSDIEKILQNLKSKQANKIFRIQAYQVDVSTNEALYTDYFINDILFFSQAKAVNLSVYINKSGGNTRKELALHQDYHELITQRGSGYLVSSALGNFALMHSTGGGVFIDKSNLLTLKMLFPINNKREHAINNSFIFSAKTKLSVTTNIDMIIHENKIGKKKPNKSVSEYKSFFTGVIVIDGQREYVAPQNLKITGKTIEIKVLKKNLLAPFWRDSLYKVI